MRPTIQLAEESEPCRDTLRGFIEKMTHRQYYRFSSSPVWKPAVNVYEDASCFYLCVELSGIPRERISVEVLGQRVVIKGERPTPSPTPDLKPGCILRMEIDCGPFERVIELPEEANMNQIDARLTEGFLWVVIGKNKEDSHTSGTVS